MLRLKQRISEFLQPGLYRNWTVEREMTEGFIPALRDSAPAFAGGGKDIGRNEERDRPWPARGGYANCPFRVLSGSSWYVDSSNPFSATAKELFVIELLECIAVGVGSRHFLDYRQHRYRCLERFRHARSQERRSRAVLRRNHRNASARACKAVGHGGAGIFCPIPYLLDSERLGSQEHGRRAALSENFPNPGRMQCVDNRMYCSIARKILAHPTAHL